MIIKNAELETVCGITSVLPKNECPEFAFSGKSNVGKSSLINALMNRKSLARTSGQPGKTQTINYYKVNASFYYVDLPGYGYAKVSKEIKAKWGKMIEKYLKTSKMLKKVFLLVDIRHDPGENDRAGAPDGGKADRRADPPSLRIGVGRYVRRHEANGGPFEHPRHRTVRSALWRNCSLPTAARRLP